MSKFTNFFVENAAVIAVLVSIVLIILNGYGLMSEDLANKIITALAGLGLVGAGVTAKQGKSLAGKVARASGYKG